MFSVGLGAHPVPLEEMKLEVGRLGAPSSPAQGGNSAGMRVARQAGEVAKVPKSPRVRWLQRGASVCPYPCKACSWTPSPIGGSLAPEIDTESL